jgi:polysaccharide export outer membrane protein
VQALGNDAKEVRTADLVGTDDKNIQQATGVGVIAKQVFHGPPQVPHELAAVSLPTYVINAPDVLQIDALRLVPKGAYRIRPLDVLSIQIAPAFVGKPIAGLYTIEPDGSVNLGFDYGTVKVDNMTLEEAKEAILKHLKPRFKEDYVFETVSVVLAESRGLQQVRGPHLVHPDGTVNLGLYGSVHLEGLTIADARLALEQHMSQYVQDPEISVDVVGFNSKVYYVITEGAGPGGTLVTRFPMTGQTTVLDALSQVNGLSVVSSRHLIYLVRPTASGCKKEEEVYHVDWHDVASKGKVATNYQILPNDRLYIRPAPLVVTDTYVGLFTAPFERLFSAVGLGNSTVRQFLVPIPKNVNTVLTQTVP